MDCELLLRTLLHNMLCAGSLPCKVACRRYYLSCQAAACVALSASDSAVVLETCVSLPHPQQAAKGYPGKCS
jgi:hypothetical protein